ncbi:hypothetical protein [Microbacterium sp.]|uniref:hypothetical protein n=1 Tax=Microbacterium sp. TaxID=51671 RepID=UPI002C9C0ED7|nr:hypothetical protein [Microbacterium sp.]HWK76722.1 hypothetical protein [Microbacterium sp.]
MSVPNPPAAPAPQQLPPPMPPVDQAVTAPKKTNVLALIALITAAVGFLFACIPGALIVGWILLPIAFVTSIVSLFLKGDRKWMGVVGLVLSIVGTIVGFAVFFAVVANAAQEAFGSGDTVVSQPADEDAETAAEEEPADAAAEGTRENPYPLGSTISSSDWTVVVNSHTADGAAAVAANGFNEAAPAGSHYEVINYTVTYTGEESGLAAEVAMAFVTSAGNVVNSYDNLVILEDGFGMDELYNGASATGSEAFLVPDGETALIRVRPGMFADEVFVQP